MNSHKPRPLTLDPFAKLITWCTPGPLGKNDYADVDFGLGSIMFPTLAWSVRTSKTGLNQFLHGDTPGPLGINDHAQPASSPSSPSVANKTNAPAAVGPLLVSQGQITFDAEGNDIKGSPYFSRVMHWPGGISGVTIGRGYDMGDRSESAIIKDMTAAGLPIEKAKELANAHGKKGENAREFVVEKKVQFGELPLTVQKNLFENIYPGYVQRARKNYEKWTTTPGGKPLTGKVSWDDLHWAIRDVLVDFVYQGFTKGPNPMVAGMRNDIDEMIQYIRGSAALQRYEPGRKRVKYLENSRAN